jgi:hypothetical protein
MCYEESLFRSWTEKKAQKRQRDTASMERAGPVEQPIRPAPLPETTRPKEAERELETIV